MHVIDKLFLKLVAEASKYFNLNVSHHHQAILTGVPENDCILWMGSSLRGKRQIGVSTCKVLGEVLMVRGGMGMERVEGMEITLECVCLGFMVT